MPEFVFGSFRLASSFWLLLLQSAWIVPHPKWNEAPPTAHVSLAFPQPRLFETAFVLAKGKFSEFSFEISGRN
jgi:hypothetical protein